MTTPREYNAKQLAVGALTIDHVTELIRYWQAGRGLAVDGKAGPRTLASIALPVEVMTIDGHWLAGPGVTRIAAHASWFGGTMSTGSPRGVVAHYTATDAGTAVNMANRRARELTPADRIASWHVTIETDGSVVRILLPISYGSTHTCHR